MPFFWSDGAVLTAIDPEEGSSLCKGSGAEIDRLVADKDIAQMCPYYVDLQVEGPRLQAIVNKMKSISSTLTLVTTKHGHLHLQVAAEQVRTAPHGAAQTGTPFPCE